MSEAGFHVHGPHDHELEHVAESAPHARDMFASRIAVMTAIIATLGAMFGYMAGATQNDALLYKNEAAIKKTEASDQWNYYQAKSGKQNMAELGATLTTGEQQARYRDEIERYKKEKEEVKQQAEALERAGQRAQVESDAAMHNHHRWAQAMTLIQIAISLAAITLLTRSGWLNIAAYGVAAVAIALGALAFAHV